MTALLRHQPADGTPTWWASWAVRSASLPLPSEHRDRYRQEFLAELYGMTPAEQLHHATGIVSRVWALRVSLTDTEPARLMSKEATMAKALAVPTSTPPLAHREGLSGPAIPRMHPLRGRQWRLIGIARWRVRRLLDGQEHQTRWHAEEPPGASVRANEVGPD